MTSDGESVQPPAATIGQIVDGLGCSMTIPATDMVTDVVVLAKVLEPDGSVRMLTSWSKGMSSMERVGMVTLAQANQVSRFSERQGGA